MREEKVYDENILPLAMHFVALFMANAPLLIPA